MKLADFLSSALAGLAGVAAAATQETEIFLLRSQPAQSDTTPSIPPKTALAVLQQRLGAAQSLPESISDDDLETITFFGRPRAQLFKDSTDANPYQLLVVFKNADHKALQDLKSAVASQKAAFKTSHLEALPAVSYIPSSTTDKCAFKDAVDPDNKLCWKGNTQYLEYDLSQDRKIITSLSDTFGKLQKLVEKHMETTLVFLPKATTPNDALRRRVEFFPSEQVLDEVSSTHAKPDKSITSQSSKARPFVKSTPLPACFTSQAACENATASCSGHGQCRNRYSASSSTQCFACHCLATKEVEGSQSIWHWGGAACEKQDVSVPFWLFVGFTVFLVGTVGFAISLLFAIGEEKLPGVIGAGVSRGSK